MRRALRTIIAALALAVIAGAGLARGQALKIGDRAPEIVGGPWLNSTPLAPEALRGRVLLVDFWTYG